MTAATKDRNTRTREYLHGIKSYPMKASTTIFKGTLVAVDITTGLVEPATNAANKRVVGVAFEKQTSAASGTTLLQVLSGRQFLLICSGLATADIGAIAYVTDDQTVQITIGTAGVKAGRILEVPSATEAWVYIPHGGQSVAAVSPNGSDLATTQTLANELKAVVNDMLG